MGMFSNKKVLKESLTRICVVCITVDGRIGKAVGVMSKAQDGGDVIQSRPVSLA